MVPSACGLLALLRCTLYRRHLFSWQQARPSLREQRRSFMNLAASSPLQHVRPVVRKLRGMPASDGAGVQLTRIIGTPQLDSLDPFLLLDGFGYDDPGADDAGCT